MPPKIKKRCRRRLGARQYKNYSEEMLLMAVDLVRNKNITSYDAEKQFGIPRRTIEKRVKNLHSNKPGPRFRLSEEEESKFVKVLVAAGDYGCPLSQLDFKLVVYDYLKKNDKTHLFNNKIPGDWWVKNFLERHKEKLTLRSTQNITRARAAKTLEEFQEYFKNLESSLTNVPAGNIMNFDETNVSDDPGSTKCIFRRGVKYPERILNHSKGCISIMFAATADGVLLPPYVVYKSECLWEAWCKDGPMDARYNRTKSGWFDSAMFLDWFTKIVIPWAKKLEGPKLVIGDNLSSHLNPDVIELCEASDIRFVFLPSRSTQIAQPLDVAFFGPLKKAWRQILLKYKTENPKQTSLNKCHFPLLLNQLIEAANMKKQNIISGFKATGIHPFNPYEVFKKMPEYEDNDIKYDVDQALLDYFKQNKHPNPIKSRKNTKLNVLPGKSVSSTEIAELSLNKKDKTGIAKGTKKNLVNEETEIEGKKTQDTKEGCKDISTKRTSRKKKLKKKYVDTIDSDSTCSIPSSHSSDYDPKNDENSDTEMEINEIFDKIEERESNDNCNRNDKNLDKEMEMQIEVNDNFCQIEEREKTIDGYGNYEKLDAEMEINNVFHNVEERKQPIDFKINVDNKIKQNLRQKNVQKQTKDTAKKVTVLSDIKNTPENKKYFNLMIQGPFIPVAKENKLIPLSKKDTKECNAESGYDNEKDQKNTSIQQDNATAGCSKEFQNTLVSYNIYDHVLVRYISQKKVQYFVGKIIAKIGNKYKVSFYKRRGRSDSTIFTQPLKDDIDTIDEQMIVKEVQLLPLNEQGTSFVFLEDDDLVYFDY